MLSPVVPDVIRIWRALSDWCAGACYAVLSRTTHMSHIFISTPVGSVTVLTIGADIIYTKCNVATSHCPCCCEVTVSLTTSHTNFSLAICLCGLSRLSLATMERCAWATKFYILEYLAYDIIYVHQTAVMLLLHSSVWHCTCTPTNSSVVCQVISFSPHAQPGPYTPAL